VSRAAGEMLAAILSLGDIVLSIYMYSIYFMIFSLQPCILYWTPRIRGSRS